VIVTTTDMRGTIWRTITTTQRSTAVAVEGCMTRIPADGPHGNAVVHFRINALSNIQCNIWCKASGYGAGGCKLNFYKANIELHQLGVHEH